jgi:hypothetical protein
MLRRLDSKFDRMTKEMREMKGRLNNVEIVISALVTADGRMQHAIDRMSDRLDRIERRLDITTTRRRCSPHRTVLCAGRVPI